MKAPLRAAVLAAFFSVSAIPAFADEAETTPTQLSPVVVIGTRSAESENRLPAAVTVITQEEIARSGASHVVEVLRASGAAQVSDLYGDGSNAQIDVRGFGDTAMSNTLILVDGRPLNNPDMGSPDLSSIALKDVERIEIVQGSASVLYGDQAVGGVINIITRSTQKTSARLEGSAGSYKNLGVRGEASQRLGAFGYRLSAEERGSDNYRDHNHTEYRNLFGRAEYNYGKDSQVFAEVGYVDQDLELPGALNPTQLAQDRRQVQPGSQNDFTDTRTKNFRVGIEQDLISDWKFAAEASNRTSHSNNFAACCGGGQQDREIYEVSPRVIGKFALPNGQAQLTFGLDGQKASWRATYGLNNHQKQQAVYTQLILPLPAALEATVGGRIAHVDNEANAYGTPVNLNDTQYAHEVGLAWRPVKQSRVFARYEKNFRFAKVDEFTYTDFGSPCEPNKPLCTQTGKSYEIGTTWTEKRWSIAASVFRLDVNKEIAYDPTLPFGGANFNLPKTRRDGQNLRLNWQALQILTLGASYQHVNARVTEGALTGKEIPLVASQTATASADVSLPLALVLHTELAATSNRAFGSDFSNNFGKLAGYTSTNIALSRNTGHWQFTARINNLFNNEYSEYGVASNFAVTPSYYPSPGINGLLTLRYVY